MTKVCLPADNLSSAEGHLYQNRTSVKTFPDELMQEWLLNGRENKALKMIYESTLPKVRKYILQNNGTEDEAEDIFQDTILIFYNNIKSGNFKTGSSIEAYLITISKNLYINYVKRHVNRYSKNGLPELKDDSSNVIESMISGEKDNFIDLAFSESGCICSRLFKLTLVHRKSMKEIAALMGYANENVAKAKHYKCKQKLGELLKSKCAAGYFRF